MAGFLLFAGFVLMLVGCIAVAVSAFRTSIVWGVCVLIMPGAAIAFALIHRGKEKLGIAAYVAGYLIMFISGGMIASVMGPKVKALEERSEREYTLAVIRNTKLAVFAYHSDHGRFPTTEEGLALLVSNGKSGAYFDPPVVPVDAWRNPLQYIFTSSGEFTITSYGADGRPGGAGQNTDLSSDEDSP